MPDLWLPQDSIYLSKSVRRESTDLVGEDLRPARPWNQGDIFLGVPIAGTNRLKEGKSAEDVEKARVAPVMLLGHACSIRGGGRLATTQTVAEIKALPEGVAFDAPWDQSYFRFPLPDFVDGETWLVDFRSTTFTHFKNLEQGRVASLSLEGLAALHRRYVNHVARVELPLEPGPALRQVFNEIGAWEAWTQRGHEPDAFSEWLDGPLDGGPYAGEQRRALLEFAVDYVIDDIPDAA